ncbi:MAG TPA: hypothetical protein VJU85_06885 [Nitrososphaeraceae archaeon]|nr:hypothetical protein [Nitrososphaeraceae archaeon]
MPHIVLTNVSDFESFFNNFKKDVFITKNKNNQTNTIIRFEEIFLNQLKNIILIKTITIENSNQSQTYYIMAMKKNNQITIRLDPLTDPKNKTDAVKTSLVYIAKQYKKIDPAISIGKTNLEQYLL